MDTKTRDPQSSRGEKRGLRSLAVVRAASLFAFALSAIAPSASAAPSLLVKGATFLTMKRGEEKPVTGYMLIGEDGKITALGAGAPPAGMTAATTLDATGKIIIPGFI